MMTAGTKMPNSYDEYANNNDLNAEAEEEQEDNPVLASSLNLKSFLEKA